MQQIEGIELIQQKSAWTDNFATETTVWKDFEDNSKIELKTPRQVLSVHLSILQK